MIVKMSKKIKFLFKKKQFNNLLKKSENNKLNKNLVRNNSYKIF